MPILRCLFASWGRVDSPNFSQSKSTRHALTSTRLTCKDVQKQLYQLDPIVSPKMSMSSFGETGQAWSGWELKWCPVKIIRVDNDVQTMHWHSATVMAIVSK